MQGSQQLITEHINAFAGEEKEILVEHDDGIRPDISAGALGKLKAVFKKDGTTTAGNSSQVCICQHDTPLQFVYTLSVHGHLHKYACRTLQTSAANATVAFIVALALATRGFIGLAPAGNGSSTSLVSMPGCLSAHTFVDA